MWEKVVGNILFSASAFFLASGDSGGDYFKAIQPVFKNPGKYGPWILPTRGKAWPKPKVEKEIFGRFSILEPERFEFLLTGPSSSCDILQAAVNRYYRRTFPGPKRSSYNQDQQTWHSKMREENDMYRGVLERVDIVMNNPRGCEERYPSLDMDESYEIKVDALDKPHVAQIVSFSVWGVLRGLETFSQLVYTADEHGGTYQINSTKILDSPRFSHRGILIDSSRHFLSKRVILDNLDLMEMNKMNVFHWHMTDDPAFPYESSTFPNMSLKGAYRPHTHVYTQEDIRDIIEYARNRGIRVIAEFDVPGHTESWEPGNPGLLTPCYHSGAPNGEYGPMDPTKKSVFDFLHKFFKEVTTVFPDKYLHIGGDEVTLDCWKSNPSTSSYVQKHHRGNFRALESEFINKLLDIIKSYPTNNGYIVWQEVFDNKDKVKEDTIVEVWKGGANAWGKTMSEVTKSGLRGILSSPWYLNYISYGADWVKYYQADPHNFPGTEQQKKLVIGGEACMWGEFVNSVNLIPRLWPRASAVAERLWSPATATNVKEAAQRLQEMECRLLQRGYPVEPANGPGFCDVVWEGP